MARRGLHLLPGRATVARSKTGEADDAVVMDSARTPWIGYVLSRLADGPADEKIFPWDYSQFYQMFVQAAAALGYKMAPYQGRHSGISIDRAHRERSLEECMKRGCKAAWRDIAAFFNYRRRFSYLCPRFFNFRPCALCLDAYRLFVDAGLARPA